MVATGKIAVGTCEEVSKHGPGIVFYFRECCIIELNLGVRRFLMPKYIKYFWYKNLVVERKTLFVFIL